MGVKDLREILEDKDLLVKFIKLRAYSSENLSTLQLAEVFRRNQNLTEVRSYDEWKSLGRQVCAGEHGYSYLDIESKKKRQGKDFLFIIKN